MLRLRTLGGLSLDRDGVPVHAGMQRRVLALLAVLAAAGEDGISRDRLVTLFWPDAGEEQGRNSLRQALFRLRRDVRVEEPTLGSIDLRLNPTAISSDLAEFRAAVHGHRPEHAVTLYRGPFLDGFALSGAPQFERWVEEERARIRRRVLDTLDVLATEAEARGDCEVAAGWWRRLSVLDPLGARAALGLMRTLASAGDIPAALQHARVHDALMRQELDISPDPAVAALAERLRQREGETTPARRETPPRATTAAPPVPALPPVSVDASLPAPIGSATSARRRLLVPAAVVGAVALALTGSSAARLIAPSLGGPVDQATVVVAPFQVLDPHLGYWREGMVDVLSRNLDGAGPLRTVSPSVAIGRLPDRPERASVTALGRATGAGFAVFGDLIRSGADSVRVRAVVLDVSRSRVVAEVTRRDAITRMDRLTDSLTVAVLRVLSTRVALAAAREGSLGQFRSLDALKAFLLGEQHFRRTRWDSARVHYEAAVAADSTFALPLRRLGQVLAWQRVSTDPASAQYLLRAGALNHGLSPHDSLLVLADSLSAAATSTADALTAWRATRRLFATLDSAVARYPGDPEAWFQLGEAGYHFGFGPEVGQPEQRVLSHFDRAILLDSAFAPAYIHPVELALNLHGPDSAEGYATRYLALNPMEAAHRGVRLVIRLLDPQAAAAEETTRLLDTAATDALVSARTTLRRWPDPAETATRVGRLLAAGRPSDYPLFADVRFMRQRLAEQLAFRGHLAEAVTTLGPRDALIFAELAYLGAVPSTAARARFAAWTRSRPDLARHALAWWSANADTASIDAFERAARGSALAAYDEPAARAHRSLARGDSALALRELTMLPDTLCATCYLDRLTRARLLAAAGRARDALPVLREPLAAFLTPMEVVFAIERARVARLAGATTEAESACSFARAAWASADPAPRRLLDEACGSAAIAARPARAGS
ncbi:transcriptional activator domain-containing protein [Gemmatirosa kalamazoonensis]|uniref:Transcriptional activator domain-containing protein n=1 Tax=Gemmatirosa kalamazoonensis TaxID=861299 RepID=W0REE9_9BACT|nr:BTAD domain-containing putative transcriptional regulator [Gemmatirosa kalamazoonensis]AHG88817.1 transcriptional activator domain-containing protein [Gemmatirosa kalamazoonensis]